MKKITQYNWIFYFWCLFFIFGCEKQEHKKKSNKLTPHRVETFPVTRSKKIVVYTGFQKNYPFWDTLKKGAETRAKEKDLIFINLTPTTLTPHSQVKVIENSIAQKVDGIILGAIKVDVFSQVLTRAQKANIPVIVVDTPVKHPAVRCIITTNNYEAAQLAGKFIIQKTKGKGTLFILGGSKGHPNGDARRDGVISIVKKRGMKVKFVYTNWNPEIAYMLVKKELESNKRIRAIFSCADPMILAAKKVVKSKGLLGKILLVGFDADKVVLESILSGEIDADVAQNPWSIGRRAIDEMVNSIKKKEVPLQVLIPGKLVTKENVREFLKK